MTMPSHDSRDPLAELLEVGFEEAAASPTDGSSRGSAQGVAPRVGSADDGVPSDDAGESLTSQAARPEATARAYETARSAWREALSRRRRQRFAVLATAATLLLGCALGVAWWRQGMQRPAAILRVVQGEVLQGDGQPLRGAELELARASVLATGADGGAAFEPAGGAHLRLGRSSRVRLRDARSIELQQGGVYFDSRRDAESSGSSGRDDGAARRAASANQPGTSVVVSVETPLATLRNLGTRYQARVERELLHVAVRSGTVLVKPRRGNEISLSAGEWLTLAGDGVRERGLVSAFDQRWSWTWSLAPPFATEGRTLGEYLGWVERELGVERRVLAEPSVVQMRLRGDLVWRSVLESLQPTLALCGLEGEIDGGVLTVRDRGAAGDPR